MYLQNREVEGSINRIIDMMRWSGLEWEEGPGSNYRLNNPNADSDGPFDPYI